MHEVQVDVEQVGFARRVRGRRAGPRPSRRASAPSASLCCMLTWRLTYETVVSDVDSVAGGVQTARPRRRRARRGRAPGDGARWPSWSGDRPRPADRPSARGRAASSHGLARARRRRSLPPRRRGSSAGGRGAARRTRARRARPRPVLARLVDDTGESAQLYVREGDQRVCVAVHERASGLRDTVPLGAVMPLDQGFGRQGAARVGRRSRPVRRSTRSRARRRARRGLGRERRRAGTRRRQRQRAGARPRRAASSPRSASAARPNACGPDPVRRFRDLVLDAAAVAGPRRHVGVTTAKQTDRTFQACTSKLCTGPKTRRRSPSSATRGVAPAARRRPTGTIRRCLRLSRGLGLRSRVRSRTSTRAGGR